jgi:hypothetical protein
MRPRKELTMPRDVAFLILGAVAIALLVTLVVSFGRSRSSRAPKDRDREG